MTVADIDNVDLGIQYTADELDEKRQNRSAYDYLCRLHEVRNWVAAYLGRDDIPQPIDLEENFRNGVLLARLSNAFAPEVIHLSKIFDLTQEKYNSGGTVYRHTDNIMNWRRAMLHIRFPEIIIPETVDVYEGRNIRTVFCLYALAIYLFRRRMAPAIKNEAGNLKFSDEDMEKIKERLQREGVNISFGDVGLMLAKNKKVDTAEGILLKIAEAVNNDDVEGLLKALKSTESGFIFVDANLAEKYMDALKDSMPENDQLSPGHIQATIQLVNERDALDRLERYLNLSAENYSDLSHILADLCAEKVIQAALPFYDEFLKDRRNGQKDALNLEQVNDIINVCNACIQVRISTEQGNADDVYESLKDNSLALHDQLQENYKNEYYRQLSEACKETQAQNGLVFTIRELRKIVGGIKDLSPDDITVSQLNRAVQEDDLDALRSALDELELTYNPSLIPGYLRELKRNPPKTADQVRDAVQKVDSEIEIAVVEGREVLKLNNALVSDQENETKLILKDSKWSKSGLVKPGILGWYYPSLKYDLDSKRQTIPAPEEDSHAIHVFQKYGNSPDDVIIVDARSGIESAEPTFESASNKPQQWTLSGEEIRKILQGVNERFEEHYRTAESKIKKGQATIREYLKRKFDAAEAKKRDRAARKIQNSYRKMKSRGHLGELQNSSTPSVECVRQFIELLRDSELDYEEEITVEKTRSKITHLIKANQKLDENLTEMDRKIGLLVKNRISLQEVQAHSKKIDEERDAFEARQPSIRKPHSKMALKAFEYLFFHLQAEPMYLVNLFEIETVDPGALFTNAVWPLFHFASENREEFLLMRLYREVMSSYVSQLTEPSQFLDYSKKSRRLIKGFTTMLHAFPSQAVIAVSLKAELSEFQVEEPREEHFNLRPMDIFESIHQRIPENLEEAMQDNHVVAVIEHSKHFIAKWSSRFTQTTVKSVELPRNIRYLLKACSHDLKTHFHLKDNEVHQLVAKFLFSTYIEASLVDPKVVKRETGESLRPRQVEILKAVTQMMSFAVAGQGYGNELPYMDSLNSDLIQINNMFTSFAANQLLNDKSVDGIYGMNRYSAFTDALEPKLHIETKYVKQIHSYLREFKALIFKDEKSKLVQLVDQAKVPEDSTDTVVLQLKPIPADSFGEDFEGNELFVETKKLVVELLLCGCTGSTVTKILQNVPGKAEEDQHRELESKKETPLPTIADKQQKIRENLTKLEQLGYVSSNDFYQAIITQIAKDIYSTDKYRNQRKEQLSSLTKTVNDLESKRKQYEERLATYKTCLNNALDNISIKDSRPSIVVQEGGKVDKKMQKRNAKEKPITVKLSGDKLVKKEIAVCADKDCAKQLSKTAIEIRNNPEKKGIFEICLKRSKTDPEISELQFQDLLDARDTGESEFMLSKELKVHTDAFITYLNRKFHQK